MKLSESPPLWQRFRDEDQSSGYGPWVLLALLVLTTFAGPLLSLFS